IAGNVGDIDNVGSVLVAIEVEADVNQTTYAPRAKTEKPKIEATPTPIKPAATAKAAPAISSGNAADILASPSLRRRAAELDIELSLIVGSGPAGRLTHDDLDGFIASGGAYISNVNRHGGIVASSEGQKQTGITEIPLRGIRRKIAEAMEHSKRNIPHYTYVEEVDLTDLEKLRGQLNAERQKGQPKLTLLPFMIKALTKAVVKFPQCNSHYNQETGIITQFDAAHIGMAANTPNGLMVPVIKHAEAMDIWQYADKVLDLANKARTGTATRDELTGSTITLTSLGKIGGIVTTPIINAPEVCIIGNNKLVERPMVIEGEIVIRKMMNISGSFDHRIVDGYDGALMIQYIKSLLEVPATLFMPSPSVKGDAS
ncbi:MAG: 2-oxo acid dehydrogenase subunit E2, partial [Rhizobiales bacterium]|nr:2-oxo acid dehydrogenase subunit E2 [Hyphomicrobiales bacterium]